MAYGCNNSLLPLISSFCPRRGHVLGQYSFSWQSIVTFVWSLEPNVRCWKFIGREGMRFLCVHWRSACGMQCPDSKLWDYCLLRTPLMQSGTGSLWLYFSVRRKWKELLVSAWWEQWSTLQTHLLYCKGFMVTPVLGYGLWQPQSSKTPDLTSPGFLLRIFLK